MTRQRAGPYADIHQLAAELAATRAVGGFSTPWVVARGALMLLEGSVAEKAGVSLADLRPVAHAPACEPPALFLHAEDDALVGLPHVESLVKAYGGPRVLAIVEGTHSSPRSLRTLDFVSQFLRKHLGLAGPAPGACLDRVPWVRDEHRLTKVSGLTYVI